jgi:hypothetical protein
VVMVVPMTTVAVQVVVVLPALLIKQMPHALDLPGSPLGRGR